MDDSDLNNVIDEGQVLRESSYQHDIMTRVFHFSAITVISSTQNWYRIEIIVSRRENKDVYSPGGDNVDD